MSEKNLWKRLRKGLAPYLELQRLEDRYSRGVPDVLYAGPKDVLGGAGRIGVVELKYLRAWPKRATTVVRLPTYRQEQRLWLQRFGRLTDAAWLLLQVEKTILLFDWCTAQDVGTLTREELEANAVMVWRGHMSTNDYAELARLLLT